MLISLFLSKCYSHLFSSRWRVKEEDISIWLAWPEQRFEHSDLGLVVFLGGPSSWGLSWGGVVSLWEKRSSVCWLHSQRCLHSPERKLNNHTIIPIIFLAVRQSQWLITIRVFCEVLYYFRASSLISSHYVPSRTYKINPHFYVCICVSYS